MHLSQAPSSMLDLIVREDGLAELNELTPGQRGKLFARLTTVTLLETAKASRHGSMGQIVAAQAKQNNVSKQAIHNWLKLYRTKGFRGLIDGRKAQGEARAFLPAVTRQWIQDEILRVQRRDAVAEVHRMVIAQWQKWRRTGDAQWAIPGFAFPPADCGKGYPSGFSLENFRRCKPTDYQKTLAAQGTIAAYRDLPSILSTRVGMHYLETVMFDDEQTDVHIRALGYDRPMRPLSFNSIDRLISYNFPPHIRLRWFDTDEKTHKHLTQKEFVWYVIWFLCTIGYRSDAIGTRLIQEHGTAKVWSNLRLSTPDGHHSFEDALTAFTGGCVTMDSSGLFNKAAFAELLYGPKSSGNPRFKAGIESSFHTLRTYSNYLIGASGRNAELAPEENYGIDRIERTWLAAAKGMSPAIAQGLLSNFMTPAEYGQLAHLIYDAMNNRTDHEFEGWAECEFVEPMWRWEEDAADMWRSRSTFALLTENQRQTAIAQQAANPRLTSLEAWSPARAKLACEMDPAIKRLKFTDAFHLLPTTWAKEVTVRKRHEIIITDELMPGEEIHFFPELTTLRGRKEYLQPGDTVMAYFSPLMPDTLLVCDQSFTPLGTLTRNVRIGRDNNQLAEMFEMRGRLKATLDAPVRRAMQPVADRRDAVKAVNEDLIARSRDVTPPAEKPARKTRGKGHGEMADEAIANIAAPDESIHTDDLDV
ncbi:hypothetical protein OVA24_16620 [Luteolibacter sp. SL250]|uniref:hypothetical protein n=1 Tax=Luteolibacter sp. SL250 TaxID=2995170 RepID=UPI00226FAAAB|nr:hypothetical protein [Luteolibacter sp. SL250]WAC18856.1 hypothetical protein OVA24_16620 [Luteolibacter sp. SL250]